MNTADLIKIGISVVVFVLCLVGNIHFKGIVKNLPDDIDKKTLKKKKKLKTLCFSGMLISIWFALGVFITSCNGAGSIQNYNEKVGGIKFKMVYVKGGYFNMGGTSELEG